MRFITKKDIKLPKRVSESHKGDNGLVLAVGGSKDFAGATALAGLAALRSGCDLVKIIAPEKAAWAINAYSPDLMTVKMKWDYVNSDYCQIVKKEMRKYNVLLIGNGVGLKKESKKACRKIIREIKKLKVIDADAVKSISMGGCENSIITPHSKELEYFLINSKIGKSAINKINREKNIIKKSKLIKKTTQKFLNQDNIILLKGKIDTIISRDKIFYVKGGNPGMTKGGTGDVLAGLCAGFLAQSKDLLQSSINASHFNKKIGDILLKKKKGFAYLASDMVEEIKRIRDQ
ncbi:MAG TPA: NAD(P)H-hydrate dehydratase [Candidatus Nanoarchaeia archaeon]|nr:NAD(P)H-hydrate dehydratase [Candidatus Nanoarchaeia archaeon]